VTDNQGSAKKSAVF